MKASRREFIQQGIVVAGASLAPTQALAKAAEADAVGERSRTRLADWRFHLGHASDLDRDFGWGRNQRTFAKMGALTADAAMAAFDDAGWRAVMVPHDWAVELPFADVKAPSADTADAGAAHGFKAIGRAHPQNSVGWYRTHIDVTPADERRNLSLEFDGVFRDCTVFVNGYVVATNESGYAPFSCSIGDFLDYAGGPNVVAVRVDASLGEGWFYEGAGIYRHVDLVRTNAVHVPQWGSFVRAEVEAGGNARVIADLDVRNSGAAPASLVVRQRILGPDGKVAGSLPDQRLDLAPGASGEVRGELALAALRLWSIETPHLYRLVSEVEVGGTIVDRYETPFGIRTISFDATSGFSLNGKPVKLLGTCNHQDHAGVGMGIPDALHAWRLEQLQDMGANAWRSAHNPPAAALLDLCDQKGVLMIVEARRNSSDADAMDELDRIVRRDRNHPSVILWSLGNEEPHQGTERGARITAAMQAHVRNLDPTRPTTFALDNSWDKGVGRTVDVIGFNYRTDQIEAFHQANPNVPVYGSETGSTVSTRGAYANDAAAHVVRAYDTEHPWWASTAEAWWKIAAERPYIAGGFIWTGFDYRGEPTPFPEFPSISSYFGVLDTCGFPKGNYYYYRAWWKPEEPLVHVLPHWTWPGREGEPIEVWVHGNCDTVELFLNGKSLGSQTMPRNGHLVWMVPYAPGRIEARGRKGGKVVARAARETAGAAARVMLSTDRKIVSASGTDVAMLRAEIVDARGRPVPDADQLVTFTVEGDAEVIGVGNGNPTSLEADLASQRRAFNGLAQAIVRAGSKGRTIRISATAEGLAAGRVALVAGG